MAWQGYCSDLVYRTLATGVTELSPLVHSSRWQELPLILWEYFYNHEDPLIVCYGLMLAVALFTWAWSLVFRTAAAVDRLWSIVPGVYTAIMVRDAIYRALAGKTTPSDERQLLMLALCTAWCCRLTFNFVRKGGYQWGFEDHRWEYVRRWLGPLLYAPFNLLFINFYQNLLLLLIATPTYVAALAPPGHGLTALDAAAAALFGLLQAGETLADQQQWAFQSRKRAAVSAGKRLQGELADGFLQSGLFRLSRHPNFFCELSTWWAFYLFAVAASGCWASPAALGTVLLTLLFDRSTWLTELISSSRYPEYRRYQRSTSRLLPLWPGRAAARKSE